MLGQPDGAEEPHAKPSTRLALPNRRKAEVVSFIHAERRWAVTFGRFDDGRVGEIFLDGAKESPLTDAAREAAMLASLALQFGCPVEIIRHALDGRDGSLIGAALGMIDGATAQVAITGSDQ